MNREIKFRVWHKPEKKMHSYLKAKFGKATNITLEGKFKDVEQVTTKTAPNDELEVMQYTGLKDRNGKEIYEGDITNHGEVIWIEQCAGFRLNPSQDNREIAYTKSLLNYDDIEVIGNIYESPELLTNQH